MKKSFLFGLLAIGLASFGFGGVSLADVIDCDNDGAVAQIGENCYDSLADAVTNAAGQEIVIKKDIILPSRINISDNKDITVNLNGFTISKEGAGNIGQVFYVFPTGKLTLTGEGILSGSRPIQIDGSESEATDSTIITVGENVTLKSFGDDAGGILVFYDVHDYANGVVINFAGEIESKDHGISINGNILKGTTSPIINIESTARISSSDGVGVYNAGYGVVTVSDGAEIEGKLSAIEIRAGELSINGGTFTSTAGSFSISSNGNGPTMTGAAIAISQHTTNQELSVAINGGTFVGVKALHEEDIENEVATGDIIVSVTSGTFNGGIFSENIVNFIEGGTFSVDPSDYIDTGYTVLEKNANEFVVMTLADAATDESNTANVQLPEGVTIQTGGNAAVPMDLSDVNSYLDENLTGENVIVTDSALTGEIKDPSYQYVTVEGKVFLDFGGTAKFSRPIAIRIPVGTNPVKVKVSHGGGAYGYTGLTLDPDATCNADGSVASSAYAGTDINPVNGFAVIYTCSASTFVAYTESNPAPTYGGGGGSSSSYSCKSLPANAVANNTTKPKKNTDYSYSTDTGAVCTFQCKTGYAWNETDSKCEKADETVADDETNKDETTATEDTENSDTSATEDLQKVLEDGYNVEFHKAYEFAFQNGITTMPTIEEADMNGNLNRIAMAKMLSQYAINILGKTPDTTREVPNFPDVDAQLDADYNNGVTLAYQLGIMGINIDEFRPFDLVTRAEFGTALSRMLFGLADGEGDAYYSTHLEKLMSEGIITNDNPRLDELRGYVMIMLMRSANK